MKTPYFDVETEYADGADVLRLRGDLAWDTAGILRDRLVELKERKGMPLIVDMAGLEFIDSKGISLILRARRALKDRDIALCSLPPRIREVLERLVVLDSFNVHKNLSVALDAAGSGARLHAPQ